MKCTYKGALRPHLAHHMQHPTPDLCVVTLCLRTQGDWTVAEPSEAAVVDLHLHSLPHAPLLRTRGKARLPVRISGGSDVAGWHTVYVLSSMPSKPAGGPPGSLLTVIPSCVEPSWTPELPAS